MFSQISKLCMPIQTRHNEKLIIFFSLLSFCITICLMQSLLNYSFSGINGKTFNLHFLFINWHCDICIGWLDKQFFCYLIWHHCQKFHLLITLERQLRISINCTKFSIFSTTKTWIFFCIRRDIRILIENWKKNYQNKISENSRPPPLLTPSHIYLEDSQIQFNEEILRRNR